MNAKISAAILTASVNLAVGAAFFFGLLLAMNGYREAVATYGLLTYILLAVLVTVLMATAGFVSTGTLIKRGRGRLSAAAFSIFAFSVIGGFLDIACAIAGIGVAEIFRNT